ALGLHPKRFWGPVQCSRVLRTRCALPMPPDPVGQLERSRARPPMLACFCNRLGKCYGEAPMGEMKRLLRGAKIDPPPVPSQTSVSELIDRPSLAYNGAPLREAAQLFTRQLLDADAFYRKILFAPEFQREMGTAEFHHLIGRVVAERQRALGLSRRSLIAAAYEYGVPVYTSSPGDSSIGMNVAALAIEGCKLKIDVSRDVNETAAIVLGAKRAGGKSGVLILGGGSPKNFVLQTEPQVQEVLGIEEQGHDYYVQFTDARVDTGGLSGATPS